MRALLSVSDKSGLAPFAAGLAARGWELVSTGGTAQTLRDAGLHVTGISDVTGFPEMMDGRVKTLHPKVHGGLLAIRDNDSHVASMRAHGIRPIDLLVVNLYPFEATVASNADFATCIENIDIGGPAMIRAAAKNHADVAVVVEPGDYAVRGGILDLFAPGMDLPVRLDFFGDTLESIAKSAGLTWQKLAKFNWGSDDPKEVNRNLSHYVGCSRKTKDKKNYLVNPSEYTYDEKSGTVTFASLQTPSVYIYVTLEYPYARAGAQDNHLCSDCHTEKTHLGANCLACHRAHNTGNAVGIRQSVRAADMTTLDVKFLRYTGADSFADGDSTRSGICEVCHTQTKYYRRNGTGLANHSGGVNYNRKDCSSCHSHAAGFAR